MSWNQGDTLPWEEPINLASRFSNHNMALLYSGVQEAFTGGVSYLFVDAIEEKSGDDWSQLPELFASDDSLPLWVGYLGYDTGHAARYSQKSFVNLPHFRLIRYAQLWKFDHKRGTITHYTAHEKTAPLLPFDDHEFSPTIASLASNFSRKEYERTVAETVSQINAGNFYQANITRKFYGKFTRPTNSFSLFKKLCDASPSAYSAYIRHNHTAILSSSPECFLSIDSQGNITSRPIKGSAPRNADEAKDAAIAAALLASPKNQAENLMIVDLIRHDLSQIAEPMSVKVIEQAVLYSYRTIHHLISTLRATKRNEISIYEAIHACFPPGSMTGAPKIAAIKWCATQEKMARGVYSGAIGWLGAGGTCDLSVVIRTLIIDDIRFEFQVGGGIVADSSPEDEWKETLVKARGICMALGISEKDLALI